MENLPLDLEKIILEYKKDLENVGDWVIFEFIENIVNDNSDLEYKELCRMIIKLVKERTDYTLRDVEIILLLDFEGIAEHIAEFICG